MRKVFEHPHNRNAAEGLRQTATWLLGGMPSFMSSIHLDLDAGFGAFASINAQQNYRPVPVTAYATRLYRAAAVKGAVPKAPVIDPDADLVPGDYVGSYSHADGRSIAVTASGKRLSFALDGKTYALESLGNDKFVCVDPAWRLFTFLFTRAKPADKVAKDDIGARGGARRAAVGGFVRRHHAAGQPWRRPVQAGGRGGDPGYRGVFGRWRVAANDGGVGDGADPAGGSVLRIGMRRGEVWCSCASTNPGP